MFSGRSGQGLALVVAALVGAGATYLVLREPTVVYVDPESSTCHRAFAATADIATYLIERSATDPAIPGHPLASVTEDNREAAWDSYIADTSQHMRETVNGFIANYGGEVQFLVDQFVRAGTWGAEEPTEVIVVNELGIRHLATELDAAALEAGCQRAGSAQP